MINKAKDQTLSNIGVYLPQHDFSNDKLYVALSTGISMPTKQLQLMTKQPNLYTRTYTRNYSLQESTR